MKRIMIEVLASLGLAFMALNAPAVVRYVSLNNPHPASPYTNWITAATNIQDAVDAALAGDEIVVTNGVYATGGRVGSGQALTNRVVIDKPLTVRSVNGPTNTVIRGSEAPGGGAAGPGAIRCVYMTNGAVLSGFTLTNGHTLFGSGGYEGQAGGGCGAHRPPR